MAWYPSPRSPTNLEVNSLTDLIWLEELQLASVKKDLKQIAVRGETCPQMSHR